LYSKAGFTDCPPFEGYAPDPNSVFMTRTLA
jgi:putative acetyltransferase